MERNAEVREALTLRDLRVVHRLTAALHQGGSPSTFYDQAVGAVVELLDLDRVSLLLFDPDGVMRFKAWRGLSPQYRLAVEGHSPWSADDADAEPILVPDVTTDPSWSEYGPVFAAEGIRALAFVPLVHRQRLVGKFMLYHALPHEFTAEEIAVVELIADHVALALERRRVEEDLRRQQEHLQLALSAGAMGTFEWDVPSGSVNWSPTLEALHGLAPGTFGGTFEAFCADMHPDDRESVLATISEFLASDRDGYSVTYRIIRDDGSIRWVTATGQVVRGDDGQPQRLLGVCGDVTERERLLEGERAAAARLASLQRVTAELSRAVSVADVAGVVFGVALAELGASSGSLCLVEGDHLRIVHSLGYPAEVTEHWQRFPLDAQLPASEAVRTGRAVFLGSPEERDARYPVLASSPLVGDEAFAVVPLAGGEPMGCLVFGFSKVRRFSADDERFYYMLAGQCAGALARAELYEERERARASAERARDRLAFLVEASAVLNGSLEPRETMRRLADRAVPRLADWCAIYVLEDGDIVPAAIAHLDAARLQAARDLIEHYPVQLSDPVGAGAVIRTGVAESIEAIDADVIATVARDARHLELIRSLDVHSALTVPLQARGRVIGALALVNGPDRVLGEDVVRMAHELAGRAAIAFDNARLFQQRAEIARTLQASLLPPELPEIPGVEFAARYVAGAAGVDVGGDFYDVFALDDRRFLAVVGDVCGRGVGAAALASLARHAVRSVALTRRSPAAILAHLNEVLLRQAPADVYEPRFCTAVVAVVECRPDGTATLTLATAGHPLPLLRDAAGLVRPVGSGGALVGVVPDLAAADETVELRPGDALVCFTDGVTERRDAEGRFFGEGSFVPTLAQAGGDAPAMAEAIERAVINFAGHDPSDDIAVLVIRLPALSESSQTASRQHDMVPT